MGRTIEEAFASACDADRRWSKEMGVVWGKAAQGWADAGDLASGTPRLAALYSAKLVAEEDLRLAFMAGRHSVPPVSERRA